MDEYSWADRSKYKFMIQSMHIEEDITTYEQLDQAVSTPPPPPPPHPLSSPPLPPSLPPPPQPSFLLFLQQILSPAPLAVPLLTVVVLS